MLRNTFQFTGERLLCNFSIAPGAPNPELGGGDLLNMGKLGSSIEGPSVTNDQFCGTPNILNGAAGDLITKPGQALARGKEALLGNRGDKAEQFADQQSSKGQMLPSPSELLSAFPSAQGADPAPLIDGFASAPAESLAPAAKQMASVDDIAKDMV